MRKMKKSEEEDYFKELYECKKQLLNELMVIKKIKEALEYSVIISDIEEKWVNRIKELKDDLEAMEVDLK